MITDATLDSLVVAGAGGRTVAELVAASKEQLPSEVALQAARLTFEDPSPAMLEAHARWLDTLALLEPVLSPPQRLQVCARAALGAYGGMQLAPSVAIFDALLAEHGPAARAWVEAVCAAALDGTLPRALASVAASAAAALGGSQHDPDRLLQLVTFHSSPRALRVLVEAASPAARATWLHAFVGVDALRAQNGKDAPRYIGSRLARLLVALDLFGDATSRASLAAAFAQAKDQPVVGLAARALDGERYDPRRPTAAAQAAYDHLARGYALVRRAAALPALVAASASRAVEVDDAAELADVGDWLAAAPDRRRAVAERVAHALGADFSLDTPIDATATFTHALSGVRFVLLPGGTFTMGFSDAEEALVRSAAENAASDGAANQGEEYGALLAAVDAMRPPHDVRVAPLLVSMSPLGAGAIAALADGAPPPAAPEPPAVVPLARIADVVVRSRFRLPSEAEREFLARGGRRGELTPIGHVIPDEETLHALAQPTGPFGLAALGSYPELCADEYVHGYAGAPADGSPRLGPSSLVVRGGAIWLYPWQGCGEWQLLCNAVRSSARAWDDRAAVRVVLGVKLRRHSA